MDASQPAYRTFRQLLMETYGEPVYRVPLDLGLGCPNRGPDGLGGCAFCAPDGGRAVQTGSVQSLADQARAAMAFARRRYGARRFMAYLQAFTGTFAVPALQRELHEQVLALGDFCAISIGTRPDCLSDDTLACLADLAQRLDVWVELGVQTVHDETLAALRRGHDWACSRAALAALHARGLKAAVHLIFGLPGEGAAHYRATLEALGREPLAAVKFHNLHVIRDTELARRYAEAPFPVLDEAAYAAVVIDALRRLPPHVAVMRLNTDTPAARLVAPRWRLNKSQFLAQVAAEMRRLGVRQGDLYAVQGQDPG